MKGLRQYGIDFIKQLRGCFSGVVYDKKENLWYLFTDHISNKPIYYYYNKEDSLLVFGTELKTVTHFLRSQDVSIRLDEVGAYSLLTFGYMLEDFTLAKGVKKLKPGTVLVFNGEDIEFKSYFILDNTPKIFGYRKAIKGLHERFEYAIRLEYEKDREYGYESIATLSGGLDSKANVYYANKLGFKPLCVTFSEADYHDEKIAKAFARDFGLEYLFYSLDNGNYAVKNFRKVLETNDGLALYMGAAHGFSALEKINFKGYGLLHTGQLGDAVLGTYLEKPNLEKLSFDIVKSYAYSKKLLPKFEEMSRILTERYSNYEIFAFYNRGFNGIFNGYRATEQFTDFSSPFLFVDFLEYALQIDPRLRYKERIYLEWLKENALIIYKYPWEKKKGLSAGTPDWIVFIKKAYCYARRKFLGASRKDSMNPTEYWWKTNKEIRNFYFDFFKKNISVLERYPEIKKDSTLLFNQGNMIEKSQVLTLLAAFELLELE